MIMCQCHGSQFDITTGAAVSGPATKSLNVYQVQEVEGSIQIRAAGWSALAVRR
jgi:nitrite reductase/ring-hydroxylating ferredoxin subunit